MIMVSWTKKHNLFGDDQHSHVRLDQRTERDWEGRRRHNGTRREKLARQTSKEKKNYNKKRNNICLAICWRVALTREDNTLEDMINSMDERVVWPLDRFVTATLVSTVGQWHKPTEVKSVVCHCVPNRSTLSTSFVHYIWPESLEWLTWLLRVFAGLITRVSVVKCLQPFPSPCHCLSITIYFTLTKITLRGSRKHS